MYKEIKLLIRGLSKVLETNDKETVLKTSEEVDTFIYSCFPIKIN